jgi:RimJ/RimL family protein N-acetyltransferase
LVGFLNDVEIENGAIELGYVIHPRFQGNGYATEALGIAIGELFHLGFQAVITGAFRQNAASIRVMEKNGMTRIEKTEPIEYRGKTHICVYYTKVQE